MVLGDSTLQHWLNEHYLKELRKVAFVISTTKHLSYNRKICLTSRHLNPFKARWPPSSLIERDRTLRKGNQSTKGPPMAFDGKQDRRYRPKRGE
jgi:hypothetical protein